jgi:glycosyltransferase involved in cell wall biosynthesis
MVAERKRILIVHSSLHIGGAEEVTANLCRRIDKSRFQLMVCCLKEKGVVGERIEEQGTPVIGVAQKKSGKTDYFTSLQLRKIIKQHNIQLVHSHDVHAFTDCSLCKLSSPGLRFVHTFHFGNYPDRAQPFQRLERLFWRVPSQLVAVSNRQKEGIRALYNMPDSRIQTVWNGVDVESNAGDFEAVDRCRSQGRVIIGSINTLIEQKGMFDLLKVAAQMKQRHPGRFAFLVVGDGHLRDPLQKEIDAQDLQEDVILMGWVKQASMVFLPHLDIFFQPSLWEAMSMVLLEAMANGKAIVATGVGETPYILEEGRHGRVVPSTDITAMTDALESLVLDGDLRRQYGDAAKQRYLESFTAEKMARRYEALYDSLLE